MERTSDKLSIFIKINQHSVYCIESEDKFAGDACPKAKVV